MMKRETSFARYHPDTAIRRISVLGLRNLVTVLIIRHAVSGRLLIRPYLIVDLFPYAQICIYVLYNSTSRTKTYQPPRSVSTEQVTISEAINYLMDPVSIFWEKLGAGLKVPKFKRTLRARAKFKKFIFKFN